MLIDVRDILKEAGLEKNVELKFSAYECGIENPDCVFSEHLTVTAELTNIKGVIRAKGVVFGGYGTYCARCLKPIWRNFRLVFDEEYLKYGILDDRGGHNAKKFNTGDSSEAAEAAEVYEYVGHEINLGLAVRDAVLLDIPIRHLCGRGCRSLCPICGKDLNGGSCDCSLEIIDPRFESLRGLFGSADNADTDFWGGGGVNDSAKA